jgi:ribose 5-phosphate isomerase RpiB
MKIALASDHAGYELKAGVGRYLAEQAIEFKDFGCGPSP